MIDTSCYQDENAYLRITRKYQDSNKMVTRIPITNTVFKIRRSSEVFQFVKTVLKRFGFIMHKS